MSNNPMRPVRKPPAFSRPSVDMDRHGREWRTVPAEDVEAGDVVKGRGLVVSTQVDTVEGKIAVTLFFSNGEDITLKFWEPLDAFVKRNDV